MIVDYVRGPTRYPKVEVETARLGNDRDRDEQSELQESQQSHDRHDTSGQGRAGHVQDLSEPVVEDHRHDSSSLTLLLTDSEESHESTTNFPSREREGGR